MARNPVIDFADDVALSARRPTSKTSLFLLLICGMLASGIVWAKNADIDEITRGEGQVITRGKTQSAESQYGGAIEAIFVQPGDAVTRGQVLVRIDNTPATTDLSGLDAQERAIRATVARLNAQLRGDGTIVFPSGLRELSPEMVQSEEALFQNIRINRDSELGILAQQTEQKRREIDELYARRQQFQSDLSYAQQELDLNAGLNAQSGGGGRIAGQLVPQSEILRLQRDVGRLSSEINTVESSIYRAQSALQEAEMKLQNYDINQRQEAQRELNDANKQLDVLLKQRQGAAAKVRKFEILAPSTGIVSDIHVNSVGDVVTPGDTIADIVPSDRALIVEARISPKDRGFIAQGDKARVKVTAYDFTVYGHLDGEVERIGADSKVNEATGEQYFPIDIRTYETALRANETTLPLKPGMVASVDIVTGEKTVLDYLLKPFKKAQYEALRER